MFSRRYPPSMRAVRRDRREHRDGDCVVADAADGQGCQQRLLVGERPHAQHLAALARRQTCLARRTPRAFPARTARMGRVRRARTTALTYAAASHWSGRPHVAMTIGAPGRLTRPASRRACPRSAARWNAVDHVEGVVRVGRTRAAASMPADGRAASALPAAGTAPGRSRRPALASRRRSRRRRGPPRRARPSSAPGWRSRSGDRCASAAAGSSPDRAIFARGSG